MILSAKEAESYPSDDIDRLVRGLLAPPGASSEVWSTLHSNCPDGRPVSIWEATRYLLPVAPGHLRRLLATHPELPQGRDANSVEKDAPKPVTTAPPPPGAAAMRWFTFAEIDVLRSHLDRHGAKGKAYRPRRPPNTAPLRIAVAGAGPDIGRSTLAAHLAIAAAMAGWRVLAVDLDLAGALCTRIGAEAATDRETNGADGFGGGVLGLFAHSAALALRTANRARILQGESPLPADADLDAALAASPDTISARPLPEIAGAMATRWPGLSVIGPGGPRAVATEALLAEWRSRLRMWRPWRVLAESLNFREPDVHKSDGDRPAPDIVILDLPRGLGQAALAALAAADVILLPVGPSHRDAEAAGRDLALAATLLTRMEREDNLTARALGTPEFRLGWQSTRVVSCRHDPVADADMLAARAERLGSSLLPAGLPEIPLLSRLGPGEGTVYDVDYRRLDRERVAAARTAPDAVWAAVERLLEQIWKQQSLAARAATAP